jgi:hypothetical protein
VYSKVLALILALASSLKALVDPDDVRAALAGMLQKGAEHAATTPGIWDDLLFRTALGAVNCDLLWSLLWPKVVAARAAAPAEVEPELAAAFAQSMAGIA